MKKTRITIYDIASAAGCSPATVSRALNHPEQVQQELREKILAVMDQTGFQKRTYRDEGDVLRQERSISTNRFLVSLPFHWNPFFQDVIEGILSAASGHGCHILSDYTSVTEASLDSYIAMLREIRVCGLILLTDLSDSQKDRLAREVPVIQCSKCDESYPNASHVTINDRASEKKAVEYILSTGCRRIALVSCPLRMQYAKRRREGFLQAMENAGLTLREDWFIQLPYNSFSVALDAVTTLLSQKELPDAVVCTSDIYAIACIKAAAQLGVRVPEELSIIGFDDIAQASSVTPALTTVSQPRFQLGHTAFETLYNEIQFPEMKKQHIILPTELIIRETTR